MKIAFHRIALAPVLMFALSAATVSVRAVAQQQSELPTLANPSFEAGKVGAAPPGWDLKLPSECSCTVVAGETATGERAALVDLSAAEFHETTSVLQSIDAGPWHGKRLRYRAAVKTVPVGDGTGQPIWWLSCRIERPKDGDGKAQLGASDAGKVNPIKDEDWSYHELVVDVAVDATRVTFGLKVLGKAKVWIDDVSLSSVGSTVELTAATGNASLADDLPPQYAKDPAFRHAAATDAPTQSFWTWWLTLPLTAIGLFVAGLWPLRRTGMTGQDRVDIVASFRDDLDFGRLRYFSLRFTICYWLLLYLPETLTTICATIGDQLDRGAYVEWLSFLKGWSDPLYWARDEISHRHEALELWLAQLSAEWVPGAHGALVVSNDSSDTIMGYLLLLSYFTLAAAASLVWTFFLRRKPRRNASVDLLRSFLRYALALVLLGAGLGMTNLGDSPFEELTGQRLDKSWGETSPMGLVWGFMSASRSYTVFAGLMGVVSAFLLLWRRTALLGAAISVTLMANMVMLSFCYDLPYKIASSHLLLISVLVMIPDARRLMALFIYNRNSADRATGDVWAVTGVSWLVWLPRTIVVASCFVLPIGHQLWGSAGTVTLADSSVAAQGASRQAKPAAPSLLTGRGFRWVNEFPLNR